MNKESVKICDKEIRLLGEMAECWEDVNDILGEYISILKKVNEKAVKQGRIHDGLDSLEFHARKYMNCAVGIGKKVRNYSEKFVKDANRKDLDLY